MRGKSMDNSSEITICRCEDLTLAEIRTAIDDGYTEFEELKRFLRIGMGPCQGRTCIPLVRRILASHLELPIGEIAIPTLRPPAVNTLFGAIENVKET